MVGAAGRVRRCEAIKEAAFREHTSQLPVLDKVQPFWDRYGDAEFYVLAAAKEPQEMTSTRVTVLS